LAADIADPAGVAEVLGYARERMAPLRGIVHAAGTTDDGILPDLDWDRFRRVMDPKVRGAWYLHRHTAGIELDFFVLFSAMASLVGSAGQSNYVVANAFLDALAGYRRHHGRPALSVSWGPWAEVGMAVRAGLLGRLASMGFHGLPADQALDALAPLVTDAPPHVGLAKVDPRRFPAALARRTPYTLLAGLLPAAPDEREAARTAPVEGLTRLLAQEPAAAREAVLGELLDRVAPLLGMTDADRDGCRPTFRHTRLNELGLDSLTTIRLRDRLLVDFSTDIPPNLLLGGGTAMEVVEAICQQLAIRSIVTADDGPLAGAAETEVLTL
jgi:hypothetical protein